MNRIMCIIFVTFISLTSYAQDGNYYGVNTTFIGYSELGAPDVDFTALSLIAGQSINGSLDAEVRMGFGTDDETLTLDGVDIAFGIDKFMGVYLKYASESSGTVSPYAILGYTHAKAEGSALGVSASASESDLSFGVGVDFGMGEETFLNIEYMNFIDTSTITADGISVGFRTSL